MNRGIVALLALLMPLCALGGELWLPEGIYATAVNGARVSPHQDRLPLTEGKQVVTLRYANPYRFHKEHHEVVISKPFYLVFTVDDAGPYRVQAQLPTDLQRAKRFARQPEVSLVRSGEPVAFEAYVGDEVINALLSRP
ncbi:DUF2057 family protein [Ferrimonas balearica]|uniref:DUF2057 family protein n=1 Tax=Ferrimonas balearica TaxID=44012 RepID=UPI001C9A24F8|nr:DUF2057 family protein [Ferrimonas balearica]MBY5992253.1 DUF2057 domain-containing protein [Ferrimonas balearica]